MKFEMKKHLFSKRLLSVLLAVIMVIGVAPSFTMTALAAPAGTIPDGAWLIGATGSSTNGNWTIPETYQDTENIYMIIHRTTSNKKPDGIDLKRHYLKVNSGAKILPTAQTQLSGTDWLFVFPTGNIVSTDQIAIYISVDNGNNGWSLNTSIPNLRIESVNVHYHHDGVIEKFATAKNTDHTAIDPYKPDPGTFTPKPGYEFKGWSTSDGGSVVYAPGAAVPIGSTDVHLYAVLEAKLHTVNFAAGANGTLTGKSSYTGIAYGAVWSTVITEVPTPKPENGYKFIGWSPVLPAGTSLITASAEYVAQFAHINDLTVTFTAGANGTLTGQTTFAVAPGTAWSTIAVPTPVPNNLYEFDGWTPTFPDSVTESATYTANFKLRPLTEDDVPKRIYLTTDKNNNTYQLPYAPGYIYTITVNEKYAVVDPTTGILTVKKTFQSETLTIEDPSTGSLVGTVIVVYK
jgi:hypothetical protein